MDQPGNEACLTVNGTQSAFSFSVEKSTKLYTILVPNKKVTRVARTRIYQYATTPIVFVPKVAEEFFSRTPSCKAFIVHHSVERVAVCGPERLFLHILWYTEYAARS